MKRALPYFVCGCIVLAGLSPARAEGRAHRFGKALRQRILSELSAEQKAQLRKIGGEFLAEVKPFAPALREAGKSLKAAFAGQWRALSDAQKEKVRSLGHRVRALPPEQRFGMALRVLGSIDLPKAASDLQTLLETPKAKKRVKAGEKLFWRVAKAVGKILRHEADLSEEQLDALGDAIEKALDDTREDRVEIQKIADAKLAAAAAVLTEEQRAKLEKAKEKVLAFCRGLNG